MEFPGLTNAYISVLKDKTNHVGAHPNDAARAGKALQHKNQERSAEIGDVYRERFGKSLDETAAKLKRRLDYQVTAVGLVSVGGLGAIGGAGANAAIDHKRISKLEASQKPAQNNMFSTKNSETE